jgi:ankyrin repeat protein
MDPSATDDDGWTPLHFACQSSASDVAAILLQAGASVDARDSHGNTPLWRAVFNSRGIADTIKVLRAHGADPDAKNAHGISPVVLAGRIANYDVKQLFSDLPEAAEGNT